MMNKRRVSFPSVASALAESGPTATKFTPVHLPMQVIAPQIARGIDKRIHNRFDKAQLLRVTSELYGDCYAIGRNVSAGGVLVEMEYAPPMGSVVTVHFLSAPIATDHDSDATEREFDDDELTITVRAEVKHHHYLNVGNAGEATKVRAVGLRFIEFVDSGTIPTTPLH
jgi:hypothetical protein